MKMLIALCVAGLVAPAASAQWANNPIVDVPSINPPIGLNADTAFAGGGTPTMRRQKLQQSIALRAEARQLEAADGGTLSPQHIAYLRKRVREILGASASTADTGTLVRPD